MNKSTILHHVFKIYDNQLDLDSAWTCVYGVQYHGCLHSQ